MLLDYMRVSKADGSPTTDLQCDPLLTAGIESARIYEDYASGKRGHHLGLRPRIAEQNPHLYEKDVEAIVNAILDRIMDALAAGDRVELRGLGTFAVKTCEARMARNPRTGAAVALAEKRMLAFKPGKAMKARLNTPELRVAPNPKHSTPWQSRWLGRGPSVR